MSRYLFTSTRSQDLEYTTTGALQLVLGIVFKHKVFQGLQMVSFVFLKGWSFLQSKMFALSDEIYQKNILLFFVAFCPYIL